MTDKPVRKQFERRAGRRLGFLVRQLLEDGWESAEIADAIGADRSLISKWSKKATATLDYDLIRIGISDQTIQGIVDGLGVRSDYLFMSPRGYPKTVRLKDGGERPCAEGELDHKLFLIEDAREKKEVAELRKRADATDATLNDHTRALERIEKLLAAMLPALPSDSSKTNSRT